MTLADNDTNVPYAQFKVVANNVQLAVLYKTGRGKGAINEYAPGTYALCEFMHLLDGVL